MPSGGTESSRPADAAAAAPATGALPGDGLTVVVLNRNGREHLERTLPLLLAQAASFAEIVVMDDRSSDDSIAWIAEHCPGVRVEPGDPDARTTSVNVVRNRGLRAARTRYVLMMDNDAVVSAEALAELCRVLRSRENVFAVTPRLLRGHDPRLIDSDGCGLHFLCVTAWMHRDVPAAERTMVEPSPTSAGGAVMVLDRHAALRLGGFDERYPFGWSDLELMLRARLRGWQVLHVPTASCLHHSPGHGRGRAFGQFHNRYRTLATMYSARTILLLAPMLLLFEVAITGMALASGCLSERWRAAAAAWRDRHELLRTRRRIQRTRVVSDREILCGGALDVPGILLGSWYVRMLNVIVALALSTYWAMVEPWL